MALRLMFLAKLKAKRHRRAVDLHRAGVRVRESQEVDEWMTRAGANGRDRLERHELRELLDLVEPNEPRCTNAALDFLLDVHAGACDAAYAESDDVTRLDGVPRAALRATVAKYREYVRRSKFVQVVFDKFDVDKSGALEPCEVAAFMVALADGSLIAQGDNAVERAQARVYKLRALTASLARGVISQRTFQTKVDRIGFKHAAVAATCGLSFDVEQGDVDYVLAKCDLNSNGAVDRDEVFSAITAWLSLLVEERPTALELERSRRRSSLSSLLWATQSLALQPQASAPCLALSLQASSLSLPPVSPRRSSFSPRSLVQPRPKLARDATQSARFAGATESATCAVS
ncbi:hypothetical protein M885DRAFT_522430 [Pelagophyceae sp. CCMP2097]|nr:hypothetical protein M885DRAFT_522430 [Pelagophyceae sp. CCMP2097]|mmetsp:Transcript_8737/g.28726  ORF Transcript_8737/g.28726 Transcript_8737/m.28726 type:complete len:346 (-) Transcript_8737:75-1112(-)